MPLQTLENNGLSIEAVRSSSVRRIERALPIRSSFWSIAIGTSMTAVTVECDENRWEIKRRLGALSPAARVVSRADRAV